MNKKTYMALLVAATLGVAGCADDGKDGADGAPGDTGPEGPGYVPPMVSTSDVTYLNVTHYAVEDGQVTFEFEATDAEGLLIEGLDKAEAKFSAQTERGMILSRSGEGEHGGYGTFDVTAEEPLEGATLEMNEDGLYTLVMPMPNVTADQEGIVWLRAGGGEAAIARSMPVVVNKPEGFHTTTTESCYACHTDYATSSFRHPSYTAVDINGDVDFVAGCMTCHGNVSRAEEDGGYATNTLSKIGHINHQKFEKDFQVTNCTTCHTESPVNTSIAGPGCVDCHSDGTAPVGPIVPGEVDVRAIHTAKVAIDEKQAIRANHSTSVSAPYWDATAAYTVYDRYGNPIGDFVGGYCVDLALYDTTGEAPVMLDIPALYEAGTLVYTSAYLHGYYEGSVVGRPASSYGKIDNEDGTRTLCFSEIGAGVEMAGIMASSRITFSHAGWVSDDGREGVSFTAYSPVVAWDGVTIGTEEADFDRRQVVLADTCTACHNSETNYHKNGSYDNGGWDCMACHNNGQDRSAKNSAPGFGPMVHSMHWGVGNELSGAKQDEEGNNVPNSADRLNADNCVSCHEGGVSLAAIPNNYMLSKAYNGGTAGVMSSPVTANCFACHNDDAALNHMKQNGGELNVTAGDNWYTISTPESCATCHDTGKTFGIDKYHNF
ncbi:multiheme c-type cytochrome [Ferrimonas marina]|nr:hypothetical protein [Ferrimonas marina]